MQISTPSKISRVARRRGFTLIELLMVIAVILILAGITFGISRGVQNAQARAKAKAELATISQALEQFKSRYGDYPWISVGDVSSDSQTKDAAHGVLKTLVGWQSVTGTQVGEEFKKQQSTLDVSKLSLSGDWPESDSEVSPTIDIYFIDPWGNPYVYMYKDPDNDSNWERFGYILFSKGPDGRASSTGITESEGEITAEFRDQDENIDNIFVGE
ncbi:MAG: prepilin-type N-terminal cleavage/methylation domain-containing protein [Verrucomicrobia bacterium]|jgi:prepilin-type N-terminal cleavage/methylation domain-containing protein|nr:prepilin-type N-terminal cleavage/methylation domain-containing protein [Verrucomicrobiota bacterium]